MRVGIARINDGNIITVKDYEDIRDKGEVAHMIAELENIKLDLLEIWNDLNEQEES